MEGFVFAVIAASLMAAFWSWAHQSGQERKEQGKPNYLRPIIIVVVGAMAAVILWAILTGN